MMASGWVFRVEIVTENTPYTKDMIEELDRLFESSDKISGHLVEEIFCEKIKLFEKQEAHRMTAQDKWERKAVWSQVRQILRNVAELSDPVIDRIYNVYQPLDKKEAS